MAVIQLLFIFLMLVTTVHAQSGLNGGVVKPGGRSSSAGVTTIVNSDGTLTISPTSGNATASLNLSHANTWLVMQTFPQATINAGALAAGSQALNITATQPLTPSALQAAVNLSITGNGSASQSNIAFLVNYIAGYTGSSPTSGLAALNMSASTGNSIAPSGVSGNIGDNANAVGTTTGLNVGVSGRVANGNNNFGTLGVAGTDKVNALNIGAGGFAQNNASGGLMVGGWFTLGQRTFPAASAAIIADTAGQNTLPIALFQVGGSTVASVDADGTLDSTVGFKANGSSGLSTVCTVTAGDTLTFTFGILTGKGSHCT